MTAATQPTTRFPNRTARGFIGGFSGPRVVCLGGAAVIPAMASFRYGGLGLLVSLATVTPVLLVLGLVKKEGYYLADLAPILLNWKARAMTQQREFTRTPFEEGPAGALLLPGEAGSLRWVTLPSGAVGVHDPHAGTLTGALACRSRNFQLLAAGQQMARVSGWNAVIASLPGRAPGAWMQVIETTEPDTSRGVETWWRDHGAPDDDHSWPATQYRDLLATRARGGVGHRQLVAFTIHLGQGPRLAISKRAARKGLAGAVERLDALLAAQATDLVRAGVREAVPLTPGGLAAEIESAYKPGRLGRSDLVPGLDVAGPMAITEHRTHVDLDGGAAAVLWIKDWPRSEVGPSFLHSLIFESGVHKSLCLFIHPKDTATAVTELTRERNEITTEKRQAAKADRARSPFEEIEEEEVLARSAALTRGYMDAKYTGFITVTAPDVDALDKAVTAIESAAAAAQLQTEPMTRQHLASLTAARLPLGRKMHSR